MYNFKLFTKQTPSFNGEGYSLQKENTIIFIEGINYDI